MTRPKLGDLAMFPKSNRSDARSSYLSAALAAAFIALVPLAAHAGSPADRSSSTITQPPGVVAASDKGDKGDKPKDGKGPKKLDALKPLSGQASSGAVVGRDASPRGAVGPESPITSPRDRPAAATTGQPPREPVR